MTSVGKTCWKKEDGVDMFVERSKTSFSEVMSEELAKKLQEEEETKYYNYQIKQSKNDDDINEDEKEDHHADDADDDGDHVDRDYALALKLQLEYEIEKEDKMKQMIYDRSGSKVGYTMDVYNSTDDDDSEDDSDYDFDQIGKRDDEDLITNEKPYHLRVKTEGRVTKHDMEVSSLRNGENLERFMDAGNMKDIKISGGVYSRLVKDARKQQVASDRVRGNRRNKSTHDYVLDEKTRKVVLGLINSGMLHEINGIVSTGKEANIYHGSVILDSGDHEECAIKIFKTTLNEFRNRMEYLDGDPRFTGRCQGSLNTRKLVNIWAEKEMRNLKRMKRSNMKSPIPFALKKNVLVMRFLGEAGIPSPRLKDASLSSNSLMKCYSDLAKSLRRLYHVCGLVHADLSEYNILYHKKQPFLIDLGQAVQKDHPLSLDFLKRDCAVITQFFASRLNRVPLSQDLFKFIVQKNSSNVDGDTPNDTDESGLDSEIETLLSTAPCLPLSPELELSEKRFISNPIPQNPQRVSGEELFHDP